MAVTDSETSGAGRTEVPAEETVRSQPPAGEMHFVERFDAYSRFLHLLVILSFLSLAVTGMVIKFSDAHLFQALAGFLGGYAVTGFIHRASAIITFLYFFLHLRDVLRRKKRQGLKWRDMLTGDDTLVPRLEDLIEFARTIKWFVGKGPRPKYGRWTYYEKFDYLAVFWGVFIIGLSGLVLWFPVFFTGIGLPGWMINAATIVHSDEALLAAGFIFTIHFFNTHFRPDKFPMDTVIFTGRLTLKEFRHERPRQYERMIADGVLERHLVDAPSPALTKGARIFGFFALAIGVATIIMIVYSLIISFH